MTYNVHEIINRHSLPVMRGKQTVYEFLKHYYDEFLKELVHSASANIPNDFQPPFYQNLITDIVPKIETQCKLILEILAFDQKHEQIKKRERFNELMHLLEQNGALRTVSALEEGIMVRIRQGKGPFDRKALFHISYNQRQFASSQRFSIPGDPCLYLSLYPGARLFADDMLELSWIESGMPKTFHTCLFEAQEEIVFLHFAKKGSTYLQEYDDANTAAGKLDRQGAIDQYLLIFPLRVACFISIEDKLYKSNVRFYEEYIIPQLLMEWIQQSSHYDGLTYQSASGIPEAKKRKSYNVAIPTKNIDPCDGYDVKLKEFLNYLFLKKLICPKN